MHYKVYKFGIPKERKVAHFYKHDGQLPCAFKVKNNNETIEDVSRNKMIIVFDFILIILYEAYLKYGIATHLLINALMIEDNLWAHKVHLSISAV